ncbi:MAG: hypothetical protein ACREHD_20000, partial [Pirellulales bacterium]
GNYLIVVVDHDRHLFNVIEPTDDDSDCSKAVTERQEQGRNVQCFTAPEGKSKEQIASQYAAETGYLKWTNCSVLD